MKVASSLSILAFVPVFLALDTVCSLASADDQGPTPATARAYARLLQRFDSNRDGLLQTTELPAPLDRRLGAADSDHDGVITPEELHRYGVQRRAARFARADKNADGKLDPSEVGADRWDYLKVADADGNGTLTLDEIERAVASGTLHGMSAEEVFQLLDRNGDGVIDLSRARERERALLGPADTNHDGKVTFAELKAYRVAIGRD
jgi:Ca2+-binding EF-hand superfamily protein